MMYQIKLHTPEYVLYMILRLGEAHRNCAYVLHIEALGPL